MLIGVNLAATAPRYKHPTPVLAVIPARLGATRLPRKPLRSLAGKPLVVRVYERVLALDIATAIVVATDDNEVVDVCRNHNVPVTITDTAHASGTDRVAEVVRRDEFSSFDVIVNVQGDEPFVSRDAVAGAIDIVQRGLAEVGTTGAKADVDILQLPDVVKVVTADDGRALYFSRAPIPFLRDTDERSLQRELVRQHVGIYVYRRDALLRWVSLPPHALERIERLEQLRALANGITIGVHAIEEVPHRGIDTEEDLVRANARFAEMNDAVLT
jgi:3-deoxy-manno-octulosonate cytidylyltransferase (CMP-KDO synthetase)